MSGPYRDGDGPLAAAEAAFVRGDFAEARKLAKARRDDRDEQIRDAARALMERTKVDPLIVWLSAACALFFIVVIAITLYR
jgi:hypothetical protein